MTAEQYRAERKKRGTQAEVAALLGISRSTVNHREAGDFPITLEMSLALCALPEKEEEKDKK
jgi:DNA-binding XRE family transcriptional regulator